MGILETSQDLFYITLSLSLIAFSVFLCWFMYYLIRLMKNAVYTVEKFTDVMKKLDEVLDMAKDKLKSTGTYLTMVATGVKSVMEYVGDKKESPKRKRRASKKK